MSASPNIDPNSSAIVHPRRSHNSSSLSPPSSEDDERTWLNFLRTAGGTVHDAPFESIRHRRHTSSFHSQQAYEQGNTSAMNRIPPTRTLQPAPQPHPVYLAAPAPALLGHESTHPLHLMESPGLRWQPDSEVTKCPICETEFTFWYRKHHCRKCGRVVCSACSPHRITIPRQYIIQPPAANLGEIDDEELSSVRAEQLASGEIVRVCNPCVPDPWMPTTPGTDRTQPQDQRPTRDLAPDNEFRVLTTRPAADIQPSPSQPFHQQHRSNRYRSETLFDPQSRAREANARPQLPPNRLSQSVPHTEPSATFQRGPTPNIISSASRSPIPRGHRYTASTHAHLGRPRDGSSSGSFIHYRDSAPSAPLPPPRRRIREEDECPVCGAELPAGEDNRVAHVEACIATRFSSPQPVIVTNPSSTPDASPLPPIDRRRGSSFRSRGMAVYRATEKDCVNESGESQECIICFEDFQPGDEMGRMECLCRFHRACIRRWWETKGPGSCPTHQLQE